MGLRQRRATKSPNFLNAFSLQVLAELIPTNKQVEQPQSFGRDLHNSGAGRRQLRFQLVDESFRTEQRIVDEGFFQTDEVLRRPKLLIGENARGKREAASLPRLAAAITSALCFLPV